MAGPRAALIGLLEPQEKSEDEFHAWYETEHIPSRMAVPGFLTGRRFICVDGWPRYLVAYDLESTDVLTSAPYLAINGENHTPWSKRMISGFRGYARAVMVQRDPGRLLLGDNGPCTRLLYLRFNSPLASAGDEILAGLRALFAGKRSTVQFRLFQSPNDAALHIALVELRQPIELPKLDIAKFGEAADDLAIMNLYAPWFPRM